MRLVQQHDGGDTRQLFNKYITIARGRDSHNFILRHPDIKWLRRDRDIPELAQLQSEILDAIWPHLKTGGTLVYATCSVLPEENSLQIKAFLQRTADAELCETGTPEQPGKQNLPGAEEGDGFFYAKLIKK